MAEISLQEFGLSRNEEKVYLRLLEHGVIPAGRLIKITGLHRAAVYDNIDLLSEKGLVSYVIKANRKYFYAENPARMADIVEKKKKEAESMESRFRELLPVLEAKRLITKSKQEATIYEGKKGLKSVCEDLLRAGKDMLVIGATGLFIGIMGPYAWNFHRRRAEAGIRMKIIYNEKVFEEKKLLKIKNREMRYLPLRYETPATTWIFGDNIAIILWYETPIAFVMRSKEVADSYRKFFTILWEGAKK